MRHKTAWAVLIAVLIAIAALPGLAAAEPAAADIETVINIYHTGNVRGHAVGTETAVGYARLRTILKEDNADGRLVLDAGNVFSGTAFSNLSNGQSIAALMDQIGYDGMVPGTHDFSFGSETLLSLLDSSGTAGIAVNIIGKDGTPVFEPYHIFQESGIQMCIRDSH